MDTMQIRLGNELTKSIDVFVKSGFYSNRAEVIRAALRKFIWDSQVGTIKDRLPSVEQVKKIREDLSKENLSLDEINNL